MSERPTPETDEAQHEGLLRGNPMPTKVVTANFARKLERERDAARDGFVMAVDEMVQAQSQLREAKRERDEARDIGEKLSKQGLEMMDENRTLKRECDEAIAAQKSSAARWLEQIQNAEKKVKEAQEIAACALIQRDGILNEYLNRK